MSAAEARRHPQRNIITKCIGDTERVNARIVDHTGELVDGDILFLCSDGISDCIDDVMLEGLLSQIALESMEHIVTEIYDKAAGLGASDNISLCLIRKEEDSNGEF